MSKILIGVVIAIVVVGGGIFLLNKNNSSQSMQNMNMPVQNQSQQTQQSPTTGSTQATNGKNAVTIQNYSFSPASITIKAGQSITWTNEDSVGHSATADDNSWDTGVLPQGQSKSITFAKAGTYTYHCSVHPNMKATVIVQ